MIEIKHKQRLKIQIVPYKLGMNPISIFCEDIKLLKCEYIIVKVNPNKYKESMWDAIKSCLSSNFMLKGYCNDISIFTQEHCKFALPIGLQEEFTGLIIFTYGTSF